MALNAWHLIIFKGKIFFYVKILAVIFDIKNSKNTLTKQYETKYDKRLLVCKTVWILKSCERAVTYCTILYEPWLKCVYI